MQNCRSTSTVTTDIKNGDIAKRMEAFEIIKGKKRTRPDTQPPVADGWAGADIRVFLLFDSC